MILTGWIAPSLALLSVQWVAFDRILEWWAKRYSRTIQSIVISRVLDGVSVVVSVGPDRVKRAILKFTGRLDVLERTRALVAGDGRCRNRR
ncbi:hypothetical protein JW823_07205 [bacterium]|nr:hypothetical protein [candidate division CSSED10-310 bacterium]